jgi:hypothetical protein
VIRIVEPFTLTPKISAISMIRTVVLGISLGLR